jgi:hypothetical protein
MSGLAIGILFIVNFAISWWNAYAVGRTWPETQGQLTNGWPKFMAWMGAVMSACGFTWCYLIVACVIATISGKVPPKYVQAIFELGYVAIIFPVLGSGLAITVESWSHFWRRRTFGSGALATYNTAANIYNTYEAIEALPSIFSDLKGVFSSDDDDDGIKGLLTLVVIVAVTLAIFGGILTTTLIVRSTARKYASQRLYEYEYPRAA